ncbi:MAG TPA: peptidyl-prolyl cis-trans isomerase [Solirubrobacteraceae bacterium]|nr:peptidyl-prolyl cis-trans isomerase [Solirubrobacteraceae bacterium]
MIKAVRLVLTLCVLGTTVVVAAGCGDSVPGNAVASVDGHDIKKEDFEHWMTVAAKSTGQPNASVPDPPEFTKCIAAKRKTLPKPAKGQPETTDKQLKDQCKQEYEALRDQVMQLLTRFQWIDGEAEERNIKITDAEVKKSFEEQKKQAFPKEADYQKFLKQNGQTEEDILARVRLDLLSNKIRDAIIKGKDKVSDAQIKAFYDKNKDRFAQPERRDLRVVLTKTEAKANEAKDALESGQSWKQVAKKYSIDEASKAQGGKQPAQAKGTLERSLDEAVFSADKGKITGPVKTQFGWYVFEVENVTKASQQTLDQAKETIRQTLQSQNQQKALDAFLKDWEKKWKERTECRDGYVTAVCKGGKATPTPTPPGAQPTATATPQNK